MRKKHIIALIIGLLCLFLAVSGLKKLDSKIEMPLLKNGIVLDEDAKAAKEVDKMISALSSGDEASILAAREAYDALSDEAKAKVTNLSVLEAKEKELAEAKLAQQAGEVDKLINALSKDVTLDDEASIKAAREAYESLPEEAKAKITTLSILEKKESDLLALKTQKQAQDVIDMINNIADQNDPDYVNKVRAAYDALSDEAKAQVTNLFILENAEKEKVTKDNLKVGDIVYFTGGNIYSSASSDRAASNKGESKCKVTYTSRDSKHPYHLVSVDGKGVYGWVDVANIVKE